MKKKVAFVCIHNSCRSQMAEGWAKKLGSSVLEVYSAGTEKYHEVKPMAVKVMSEAGVDISKQFPKLTSDIPQELDYLISMGCGVECPYIPAGTVEDWGIEDPSGGTLEDFKIARDDIKKRVMNLIDTVKSKR